MDVVVQPAIPWMTLNEKIKDQGLFFPIDPGPTAMIGGMVGTNCSGTNAVRYGTMKDWVVNLTIVLADGQIIKTRRRPRYVLCSLLPHASSSREVGLEKIDTRYLQMMNKL